MGLFDRFKRKKKDEPKGKGELTADNGGSYGPVYQPWLFSDSSSFHSPPPSSSNYESPSSTDTGWGGAGDFGGGASTDNGGGW